MTDDPIELLLAADVRVAATDTRFAQLEVQRGIFPLGGATYRLPREAGWGNAMRWLLTGDEFDSAEAMRLGLINVVVEPGTQLERAVALAERISTQAPLGIKATITSARLALEQGEQVAGGALRPGVLELMSSTDAQEGMLSVLERREAKFRGHERRHLEPERAAVIARSVATVWRCSPSIHVGRDRKRRGACVRRSEIARLGYRAAPAERRL